MKKGERIYLVYGNGTLDSGANAFESYADAKKYAKEWADTIAGDTLEELGNKDKISVSVIQEENVPDDKEPITVVPFEVMVKADTYDEDYCNIKVIKSVLL